MKAKVRSINSPDTEPEDFRPPDPEDVSILIQVFAGPEDDIGEEMFTVQVVTPKALGRWVAQNGPLVGRHYVMVEEWNWPRIRDFLVRAFERQEAPTWDVLGDRLGRIGHWEFEDYAPP